MDINDYILNNKFGGIWKSHHHRSYFNMEKLKNMKIIYVKRNIKDVLTSCWFYYKKTQVYECNTDINEWVFQSIRHRDKIYPYSPLYDNYVHRWIEHVNSWECYHNKITLEYEEIIQNFKKTRKTLIDYLNINIRNDIPSLLEPSVGPRKGIVGDYKNHMSKNTINIIDKMCEKYLIKNKK